ncbi:MAG: hypothetical protein CR988_02000 [Treponema sp.]|nr:MAG: hypothetical protein CR988_02000 [Treponema sp.]
MAPNSPDIEDLDVDQLLENISVTPMDINSQTMYSKAREAIGEKARDPSEVDLAILSFPKVTKKYNKEPHTIFDTADFYKKVLAGFGEPAQRLHTSLTKYLTAKDQKDKGVFRQQVITNYWNYISETVSSIAAGTAEKENKYTLRYGLLLPTLLTPDQKNIFAKIVDGNEYCEPIYYLDEWITAIGSGKISPSTTDEVRVSKKQNNERFQQLLQKASGKKQSAENLLRSKSEERGRLEDAIRDQISGLFTHDSIPGVMAKAPYSEAQKRSISGMNEKLKKLISMDKELSRFLNDYKRAEGDMNSLNNKIEGSDTESLNLSGVNAEYDTIRQMAKMTCGRKGNHFPVLSREYFRSNANEIGIRENVLALMSWIESIDSQAFCRQYKSQLNRIPPFVILVPSYGDIGFCWEPFDRYNRITSRGRIVIPMYARNIKLSLLRAVADLRWQVAKEKASYYWMEEGLTGNYYQWYQKEKLKGDVKDYFIDSYMVWMLKESEGIQKLPREIREVFWRYLPFPQNVKDELKKRAPVYQELCQRDLNRQLSDGY